MHISRAKIENFLGFFNSGDLHFFPGFNLIVGKNGSGKTVLLNALAQQIQGIPHYSTQSIPERGTPPNPLTILTVRHKLTGRELRSLALSAGIDQLLIPVTKDYPEGDVDTWDAVLSSIFDLPELELQANWQALETQGVSIAPQTLARVGADLVKDQNGFVKMAQYLVARNRQGYRFQNLTNTAPESDGYSVLVTVCRNRIYRFDAERLRRGRGGYGAGTRLASDALNLPEVLQNLQTDKHRYSEYLSLVGEVLPDVRDVLVAPLGTTEQEVRVSSLPPSARRSDLAVPLLRTGSGVAQVLAILYVVVTSDTPHVILIDEPNSFLHPSASRTLIRILKRFPAHQYIIATHSPEVMSEIGSAPVTVLEWGNEQSRATQFDGGDSRTSSKALEVVGARLSDVFGYDRVIWCEGPSDAYCLRIILRKFFPSHSGTVVVPVHSTGAFDKRRRQETIDVYRRLSKASALVPPTVGFLFDAEDRTNAQREDLERLPDVRIRFLPRRMIENFLLNSGAVTELIRSLDPQCADVQAETIREWLERNIASKTHAHGEITPELLATDPVKWTHGKHLLDNAIDHFTEGRHSFVNTRDVEPLTYAVLDRSKDELRPLADLLCELIGIKVEI